MLSRRFNRGAWRAFSLATPPPITTPPPTATPPPTTTPRALYPPILDQTPQISYEDFLLADTNRDGKISSTEWENYVRKKLSSSQPKPVADSGVTLHLPFLPETLKSLLQNEAFGLSINGQHFSLALRPEGRTVDLISQLQFDLEETRDQIRKLELIKLPLDRAASRHTNRVMISFLGYLFAQAAVVAKLTFFSRFGWDIMEPVTYFITFGISLAGFCFFTWNRLEFTYPALAGLLARRRAEILYNRAGFNELQLVELKRQEAKLLARLSALLAI
ncbi:hypothetical protein BASA81_005370 [Batrachochytrium salamandrivorans]|nr:hypothetical protein BASA81_005370 [Batrachochytrium salamandrivorans]